MRAHRFDHELQIWSFPLCDFAVSGTWFLLLTHLYNNAVFPFFPLHAVWDRKTFWRGFICTWCVIQVKFVPPGPASRTRSSPWLCTNRYNITPMVQKSSYKSCVSTGTIPGTLSGTFLNLFSSCYWSICSADPGVELCVLHKPEVHRMRRVPLLFLLKWYSVNKPSIMAVKFICSPV